jgi:hypothetical protein
MAHNEEESNHHPFLTKPRVRKAPLIPTGIDWTALVCYYKGPGTINTNDLEALVSAYAGHLPRPAAITQFFDFVAEDVEQKWLACEGTNVAATALTWESQEIWVISAYFTKDLEGTKATVLTLCKISKIFFSACAPEFIYKKNFPITI